MIYLTPPHLYIRTANPKAKMRQHKKRRRILMLILVVATFAICWLPIHLFHLATDAGLLAYNYQLFMLVSELSPQDCIANI